MKNSYESQLTVPVVNHLSTNSAILHFNKSTEFKEFIISADLEINKIVGAYSLDPNRVADIFLDFLASNFKTSWPFFISYFLNSSWWNESEKSSILANHIGFKLKSYTENTQLNNNDTVNNLILATSLLVLHNIVDIAQIYPYLYPADFDFSIEIENKINDLYEPKTQSLSMLAMMAPLDDSDDGEEKMDIELDKKKVEEVKVIPVNQKILLINSLLSVGDLKSSMLMLSRFPKIVSAFPEIAKYITRFLLQVIEPTYNIIINSNKNTLNTENQLQSIVNRDLSNIQRLISTDPFVPSYSLSSVEFTFFYDQYWKDQLPLVTEPSKISSFLLGWLQILGPHLSTCTLLLTKLIKITGYFFKPSAENKTNTISQDWLYILKEYILPAVSFSDRNPAIIEELWQTIRHLPNDDRYSIYSHWQLKSYTKCIELKYVKVSSESELRGVLRRISRDNIKVMGRQLCKVTHMNPMITLPMIIDRICFDDNLIDPIVESFRYLSDMGIDIVMYSTIDYIFNGKKSLVKENVLDISHWLSSISKFASSMIRRYITADPGPLLKFLSKKMDLILENSKEYEHDILYEFEILGDLIVKILGIELMTTPTHEQFEALQGGPNLRIEAYQMAGSANTQWQEAIRTAINELYIKYNSSDFTNSRGYSGNGGSNSSKASNTVSIIAPSFGQLGKTGYRAIQKFVSSLINNKLVVPFSVGLSKQVQMIIDAEHLTPRSLKSTMALYDSFHLRQQQFLQVYSSYVLDRFTDNELNSSSNKLFPTLQELRSDYGLIWSNSWMWARPLLKREFFKDLIEWESNGEKFEITSEPSVRDVLLKIASNHPSLMDVKNVSLFNSYAKKVFFEILESSHSTSPSKPSIENTNSSDIDIDQKQALHESSDSIEPETSVLEELSVKPESEETAGEKSRNQSDNKSESKESVENKKKSDVSGANRKSENISSGVQSIQPKPKYNNGSNKISKLQIAIQGLKPDIIEYCRSSLPDSAINDGFIPEFYIIFWMLDLYDINVPKQRYIQEINRIDLYLNTLSKYSSISQSYSLLLNNSRFSSSSLLKEKEKANILKSTIEEEMKIQEAHVKRVEKWLKVQSPYWFCSSSNDRMIVTDNLYQYCIFPRAINSDTDATYVAKFILLNQFPLTTQMFPTLILCDRIFSSSLNSIIESLTEGELVNYTRFLSLLLLKFQEWHSDCDRYRNECIGDGSYHGFAQKWSISNGIPIFKEDFTCDMKSMLLHENFVKVHFKWHTILYSTFSNAISSRDPEVVRKALLGLKMISESFPATQQMGIAIIKLVQNVVSNSENLPQQDYSFMNDNKETNAAFDPNADLKSSQSGATKDGENPVDSSGSGLSAENSSSTSKKLYGRKDIKVLARAYIAVLESKKSTWVSYKTFSTHKKSSEKCFTEIVVNPNSDTKDTPSSAEKKQNSLPTTNISSLTETFTKNKNSNPSLKAVDSNKRKSENDPSSNMGVKSEAQNIKQKKLKSLEPSPDRTEDTKTPLKPISRNPSITKVGRFTEKGKSKSVDKTEKSKTLDPEVSSETRSKPAQSRASSKARSDPSNVKGSKSIRATNDEKASEKNENSRTPSRANDSAENTRKRTVADDGRGTGSNKRQNVSQKALLFTPEKKIDKNILTSNKKSLSNKLRNAQREQRASKNAESTNRTVKPELKDKVTSLKSDRSKDKSGKNVVESASNTVSSTKKAKGTGEGARLTANASAKDKERDLRALLMKQRSEMQKKDTSALNVKGSGKNKAQSGESSAKQDSLPSKANVSEFSIKNISIASIAARERPQKSSGSDSLPKKKGSEALSKKPKSPGTAEKESISISSGVREEHNRENDKSTPSQSENKKQSGSFSNKSQRNSMSNKPNQISLGSNSTTRSSTSTLSERLGVEKTGNKDYREREILSKSSQGRPSDYGSKDYGDHERPSSSYQQKRKFDNEKDTEYVDDGSFKAARNNRSNIPRGNNYNSGNSHQAFRGSGDRRDTRYEDQNRHGFYRSEQPQASMGRYESNFGQGNSNYSGRKNYNNRGYNNANDEFQTTGSKNKENEETYNRDRNSEFNNYKGRQYDNKRNNRY
ncbi:hypothetical protein BB560_006876 [Smittium megazygosporum]|uniref:THO complex subunit 2 n=1 Tax=Smittium megazygosporum TaxID=133381 RepID=A0A2T9Y0R4_9FUNG|nr:hypothetical protein BB560_006876 [Smittium megazygosporum]